MRRALLLVPLLILLALPSVAQAGELIDRAVAGLRSDNVYVDPGADAALTDAQVSGLRNRISDDRAGPMYVVVAPEAIRNEAGGDAAVALREIGMRLGSEGTYVIAAGRTIRALATTGVLPSGEAGKLASEAIDAKGSEERRVGKECAITCRSRWSPYH